MKTNILLPSRSKRIRSLFLVTAIFLALNTAGISMGAEVQGPSNSSPPQALAPVLLIHGGDTPEADAWYENFMDEMFGVGNWDLYDMPTQGMPDPPELFHSIIGPYQGVLWHGDYSGWTYFTAASPYLLEYVQPDFPGSLAGRLLLIAPDLWSRHSPSIPLMEEGLGIHGQLAPNMFLGIPASKIAYTYMDDLDNLTAPEDVSATGIQPMVGTDPLFQMEYCHCYPDPRRPQPPYDPYVGVRNPDRQTSFYARTVTLTLPLHKYGYSAKNNLRSIMKYHMGFVPTAELGSGAGKVRLAINDSGYFGNFYLSPNNPSLVYPYPGFVEHLYQGGIWVGARNPQGELHVSVSSDHYAGSWEGENRREFIPDGNGIVISSNDPRSEVFDPDAVAPWQLECAFHDYSIPADSDHMPLGVKVHLKAMAWDDYPIDGGVVLEYRLVNQSGNDLRDLYFGLFTDMTVGNILINNPYSPGDYGDPGWDYYGGMNGGWRPGDLPGDPDIWMMYEHDADGDEGLATSWVGARMLGSSHPVTPPPGMPPVSYNAFAFRGGPEEDDYYTDPDTAITVPGRYQIMSNGHFDSGVTENGDYSIRYNWLGLLSTGPVPFLASGDTLEVAFAMVCGRDEWHLLRNSFQFAQLYNNEWELPLSSTPEDSKHATRMNPAVPNPFNAHTSISFSLDKPGWTTLEVFSPDGRKVAVLLDSFRDVGEHRVTWNGRDTSGRSMASGLYLHRLTTEWGEQRIGHMTLLK